MMYPDTLQSLVGRLMRSRPNLDRSLAVDALNDRLRVLQNRRPNWAGMLLRGVVAIPNAFNAGTIAVTTGSNLVTGSGTGWPVSDVVNTTVSAPVTQIGPQFVVPASMAGVTGDSVFYVDAADTPEVCYVQDLTTQSVLLNFTQPHNGNFTLTQSSLAALQLRMNSINPIFTVTAVTSPTSLLLDTPWGNSSQTGMSYQIILMYTTFISSQPGGGGMKELLVVVDPFQQIKMRIHVSQEELNLYDPNRTATNSPTSIADLGPNPNGNMLYEIYPPQSNQDQLYFLAYQQWRDMRAPGDRPPPFIDGSVLYHGALADALRLKIPRPPDYKDPWHNPQAADIWEARFERGYEDLVAADNSKAQVALTWDYGQMLGSFSMGANFEVSHDYDAITGNY